MKITIDKSLVLKKHYFWDIDAAKIDPESAKNLIIERVFTLGTLEEIKAVIKYYGRSQVSDELGKLNYLDPKTLSFVSLLFNKPKTEFKCYRRKQSHPQHWSL